jgi:hypothetical protein
LKFESTPRYEYECARRVKEIIAATATRRKRFASSSSAAVAVAAAAPAPNVDQDSAFARALHELDVLRGDYALLQNEASALKLQLAEQRGAGDNPQLAALRAENAALRAENAALMKADEAARQAIAAGHECVVCADAPRSIALAPCGHLCSCEDCAGDLQQCPMCREEIAARLKVFHA